MEQRQYLLESSLKKFPKMSITGGTSKTNPYKYHYDVVVATRRAELEIYKNSVLWSPRYTPAKFKYAFLYPAILVIMFLLYLRYVHTPRRMVHLRKKYGLKFPQLESKGWLNDWITEKYVDEIYGDKILNDIMIYGANEEVNMKFNMAEVGRGKVSLAKSEEKRAKMQEKLEKAYKKNQMSLKKEKQE